MIVFLLIIGGLGALAAFAYQSLAVAFIVVGVAAVYALIQFFLASREALAINGAREIEKSDAPELYRNEGNFNWPVIRLADVFLMYAEAVNELNNGPTSKAIDLVNKIRRRGALPDLEMSQMPTGFDIVTRDGFFNVIEQERIIELLAEGHRCFDIRRWRALERIWGQPNTPSVYCKDTRNENEGRYFNNASELRYQRSYICKIPQGERDRNPNLTQNKPWL